MTPRSQQVPKRSYEPHQSQAGATQSQKRKPATAQSPFQSSFGPTPTPSTSATTSTPFKRARIKQINNKREDAFHWTTTPSQRDAQHSIAGRQFDLPSLQSPRRSLLDGSHLTLTHSQSQNPSQSANEGQPLSTLQSRAVPLLSNPPSVAENQSPEKKKKGRRAQPVYVPVHYLDLEQIANLKRFGRQVKPASECCRDASTRRDRIHALESLCHAVCLSSRGPRAALCQIARRGSLVASLII